MTSLVLNNWALVFYISFNTIFKSYRVTEGGIIKDFVIMMIWDKLFKGLLALTSLLVVKMLIVPFSTISNSQVFLLKKM